MFLASNKNRGRKKVEEILFRAEQISDKSLKDSWNLQSTCWSFSRIGFLEMMTIASTFFTAIMQESCRSSYKSATIRIKPGACIDLFEQKVLLTGASINVYEKYHRYNSQLNKPAEPHQFCLRPPPLEFQTLEGGRNNQCECPAHTAFSGRVYYYVKSPEQK